MNIVDGLNIFYTPRVTCDVWFDLFAKIRKENVFFTSRRFSWNLFI